MGKRRILFKSDLPRWYIRILGNIDFHRSPPLGPELIERT